MTLELATPLRLALSKGALFGDALQLLVELGVCPEGLGSDSRKLYFEGVPLSVVTVRPSDVPTFVELGAADLGITGKDVLEEREPDVYELLDLGFGSCRMVYAEPMEPVRGELAARRLGEIRIATKYPRTAARYFERTGRQVEVIEVRGAVELAPVVGLSDGLVDLTASGRTLAENGLAVKEEISRISARLISNSVAYKLKAEAVGRLCETIDALVERKGVRA